MINSPTVVRNFIIYSICLVLAVVIGFMLASPLEWSSFSTVILVFAALLVPAVLRFHHPLLMLGWNASIIFFFLPGAPQVWLPLTALSLTISIGRRCVDQGFRFLSVRSVAIPLIVIGIVVLVTAQATGGIKLRSMGSGDVYGGKRYFFLLGAIAGFFALSAQPIPPKYAKRYMGFFLLGGITALVGDIYYFDQSWMHPIYLFIPPNINAIETGSGISRFGGVNASAAILFSFMLARYGLREILTIRHPWRFVLLIVFAVLSLFGGFRSVLITIAAVFILQFFLEGLHRTRMLPMLLIAAALCVTIGLPFVKHLPYSVQRTLAVLPIDIDPVVRMDAANSSEWRIKLWKSVLPQIPRHLLVGKGFALTSEDYDYSISTATGNMKEFSEDQNWAALAGEYHNGPLSVIITFGIWGAIAFIWFMIAAFLVVYRNFRYGDPSLKTVNAFLLATFVVRGLMFLFVVGGIQYDLQAFAGYIAMSIALNHGVAQRGSQPASEAVNAPRPLRPPLHQRPAFGRTT
jgi:hypothetical protein